MEEADVLCTRIGIVSKGKLKCIGSQQHLKKKYGKGYKIQFSFDISFAEQIHQYITGLIPSAILVGDYWGSRVYQTGKEVKLSEVFAEIETKKSKFGIKNWGLSQSSLEDVFLDIIKKDEDTDLLPTKKK